MHDSAPLQSSQNGRVQRWASVVKSNSLGAFLRRRDGSNLFIHFGDTLSVHFLKSAQPLGVPRWGRRAILAGDLDFDGFDIMPSLGNSISKMLE